MRKAAWSFNASQRVTTAPGGDPIEVQVLCQVEPILLDPLRDEGLQTAAHMASSPGTLCPLSDSVQALGEGNRGGTKFGGGNRYPGPAWRGTWGLPVPPSMAIKGCPGPEPQLVWPWWGQHLGKALGHVSWVLSRTKPFCSCLWKPSLGRRAWPHGPEHHGALHSPDHSVSTSGHNCSLFKPPLLPNQEILNQGCPSLPESTLTEK